MEARTMKEFSIKQKLDSQIKLTLLKWKLYH